MRFFIKNKEGIIEQVNQIDYCCSDNRVAFVKERTEEDKNKTIKFNEVSLDSIQLLELIAKVWKEKD
jgi:acyl carrier protein